MSEGRIIEKITADDLELLKKRPKKFWKNVVVIYKRAFKDCKEIRIVELPNSLKLIGMEAFIGCENLQMVVLPRSIRTIERDAFKGCLLNYISLMDNGEIILSREELEGKGVFVSQKLDTLNKVYNGFDLNKILKEGHYKIFFAFQLANRLNEKKGTVDYSELDKFIEEKDKMKEHMSKIKR